MAEIVLTNGEYYIAIGNNNALSKTQDINEATRFISNEVARYVKATHEKRCKGYHPMNLNPNKDRRKYSADVKRMVYLRNNGRCAICGKRVDLNKCNLDHRIPISKGGIDAVENLDCIHVKKNCWRGIKMTMIKEKNPLTEEMYSRIINTLLDSFNGSKEMIKDSRHVALILELSASLGLRISEILSLSFADFKYDDGKDRYYVEYVDFNMRETKEAAVPSACDKDIYSYVMEYKVVTLGKLFDVDMRTVRRHLIKACEKLGYRGIRTYHFRKLYYGIKCVQ